MTLLKFDDFVSEGFFTADKFIWHAQYSDGMFYEFTADDEEHAQKIADSLDDSPCIVKKIGINKTKSNGFSTFIHGGKAVHAY